MSIRRLKDRENEIDIDIQKMPGWSDSDKRFATLLTAKKSKGFIKEQEDTILKNENALLVSKPNIKLKKLR